MLQTSTKRTAPDEQHNDERPTKRVTTSSPEDGEVDDFSPHSPRHSPQRPAVIPLPPDSASSKFETKVKFPFKKKINGSDIPGPSSQRNGAERRHPVVYERSEYDQRRIREDDQRNLRSRNYYDQSRRWGSAQSTDHWKPSYGREADRRPSARDLPREPYRHTRDTYIPAWDRYHAPHPPPPPRSSPPPVPAIEPPKDDTFPPHATISIPLKRPPAPRDDHSPSPLPLPSAPQEPVKEKKDIAVDATPRPPPVEHMRKRAPVQRTRKQELEAYGRVFLGCGQQSDYDATAKLGEGTFGEVHKAVQHVTGHLVALKRILMHNEKEGMPVTALREIKILKALNHPCIIEILDMFVVKSNGKDSPLSVYMVFPYMDHDLAGLLENERVKLQPSHIKLYMKQLLEGTEYMHRNHILHRDMKAANLLIDNNGSLRIADFGLARAYDPNAIHGIVDQRGREKKYTNCVVTRWYRPPELLLGARQYGGEVDIWGIGCVLGEMFMRRPILPGSSDIDQLEKIWQLCGTPNQHTWPNYDALPGCEGVKRFNQTYSKKLRAAYECIGAETLDLLDKLLTCNPRDRITASQALDHDYFWTDPLPADPKTLPSYEASHEFDKRGRRNQPPPGIMPPDGYFRPNPLSNQPPPFFPRGPPHRDGFRPGPPPPVMVSALLQHHNGGQHPDSQHPTGQHAGGQRPGQHPGSQHPAGQHFGRPPPRGGYASRGTYPQRHAPYSMDRPSHLPPRPMAPMGERGAPHGTRGPRRGGGRHGGGGSDGTGTSGEGLPYS